jgi:sirohydrochlorin ferrochelatase
VTSARTTWETKVIMMEPGYRAERSALSQIADLIRPTSAGERRSWTVRDVGLLTVVERDPESLRPVRVVGAYLDRPTALQRARLRGAGQVVVVPLLFDPRIADE